MYAMPLSNLGEIYLLFGKDTEDRLAPYQVIIWKSETAQNRQIVILQRFIVLFIAV